MKIGMMYGVFDLFHVGHLNALDLAKFYVDRLIVGVCGDALNEQLKGVRPVYPERDRAEIVLGLSVVDLVFIYCTADYLSPFQVNECNVLIVGEDFGKQGVPEHQAVIDHCEANGFPVIRLPRTPGISTTELRERIAGAGR